MSEYNTRPDTPRVGPESGEPRTPSSPIGTQNDSGSQTTDYAEQARETARQAGEPRTSSPMGTQSEGGSQAKDYAEQAREKAQEVGEQVQEKAQEYGAKAQEQAEAGREGAASGMEKAAESLREQAEKSDGMAGEAGTKVASTMEGAAEYLREHNTNEIWNDVERYAKTHPAQALAGAVVAGFLIGRILR